MNDERPGRAATRRTVIHEESLLLDVPLDGLDLDRLRRQFSKLFDRAAHATFMEGYDLDDVINERFLRVRLTNGRIERMKIESLGTDLRLTAQDPPGDDAGDRKTSIARVLAAEVQVIRSLPV